MRFPVADAVALALALFEEEAPVLRLVVADVFVLALRKIRMVADAGAVGHPASAPRASAASARAAHAAPSFRAADALPLAEHRAPLPASMEWNGMEWNGL